MNIITINYYKNYYNYYILKLIFILILILIIKIYETFKFTELKTKAIFTINSIKYYFKNQNKFSLIN